ncbi:MAG TPA: GAF domain-containing protein [Candidatus Acidoferrum sp.]|nr:GAF domain-containing protein [Candidatus Acidoferrum sp.]
MSLNLASELERLASALTTDSDANGQFSIASLAERIAKYLNVKTEEIAIMGVSERWRHLYFIVPEALKHVGHIPLSSPVAIAARTVRESRPEINNSFRETRHVTVFESVKTETLSSAAIQKIISAPILSGDKVLGVIQVSRKGDSPSEAGPDFSSDDLGKVLALCGPLGKLLRHFIRE